jgi:hypothetical protein
MWRRVDTVNWIDDSQERITSMVRVEKSASEGPAWAVCCHLLTLTRIFLPWRWRRYLPPKRQFNLKDIHGATSRKTAFFICIFVRLKINDDLEMWFISHVLHFTFSVWFYFYSLTHSLTHGAEHFLRSRQLCSHSRNSQHFMEPKS